MFHLFLLQKVAAEMVLGITNGLLVHLLIALLPGFFKKLVEAALAQPAQEIALDICLIRLPFRPGDILAYFGEQERHDMPQLFGIHWFARASSGPQRVC